MIKLKYFYKKTLMQQDLKHFYEKKNPEWLFFWKNTQTKRITKSCLSQWWMGNPFVVDNVTYLTVEHFMMAEKARLFKDENTLKKILSTPSPALAKKLGRKVNGFNEEVWIKCRWDVIVRGNLAKFSQHEDLKQFLLKTEDKILVEASPYDKIYGIGMFESHPDAKNPEKWQGLNLLGFSLMEVRKILK